MTLKSLQEGRCETREMRITKPPAVWSNEHYDPDRAYKPGDSYVAESGDRVLVVPPEELEAMWALLHDPDAVWETRTCYYPAE